MTIRIFLSDVTHYGSAIIECSNRDDFREIRKLKIMLKNLQKTLFSPSSIHSLVFVRIAFGLTLFVNTLKYFDHSLVDYLFINPKFHFKFFGFSWVQVLPSELMYLLFVVMAVLALFIAIGFLYRASAILFLLCFTYVFLIDSAYYLNHYYMVILFSFLLCFLPANQYFSLDSEYLNPKIKTKIIPAWPIILLRLQMEIILIYAGIVKINFDWLQLYPLKYWFAVQGGVFNEIWVIGIAAYGAILLHVFGAWLLLFKKTRIWIFLVYAAFHSTNSYVFGSDIGIFPWITLALTTVFFQSHWPLQVLYFFKNFSLKNLRQIYKKSATLENAISMHEVFQISAMQKKIIMFSVIIWAIFQILFPLRRLLYEGKTAWTNQGHYFSWRMKLNQFSGDISFIVKDNKSGEYLRDEKSMASKFGDKRHLTLKQIKGMGCKSHMILQYAYFLKKNWSEKIGHDNISVYARALCSLNGRRFAPLIDPNIDLSQFKDGFRSGDWILPLDESFKPGYLLK
jgi:vitamin K-dependent gamma-carboxylase